MFAFVSVAFAAHFTLLSTLNVCLPTVMLPEAPLLCVMDPVTMLE
jgi:hypothetical protein